MIQNQDDIRDIVRYSTIQLNVIKPIFDRLTSVSRVWLSLCHYSVLKRKHSLFAGPMLASDGIVSPQLLGLASYSPLLLHLSSCQLSGCIAWAEREYSASKPKRIMRLGSKEDGVTMAPRRAQHRQDYIQCHKTWSSVTDYLKTFLFISYRDLRCCQRSLLAS